jgi:hypothetical protein
MTPRTQSVFAIVALSIVAVAAAACSSAQPPAVNSDQGAQTGDNAYSGPYSCYFADDSGADRVVGGHTLHWCGPVPRPKN